jgi:transposase-like protein
VNFCKNVRCASFCIPPDPASTHYSRTTGAPGEYTVVASGRGIPVLVCADCKESSPIRSNSAVLEEIHYQGSYLEPERDDPCCKNPECEMFKVRISLAPEAYVRFGTTPIGTQRFRCRACGNTFTGKAPRATARQRKSHKNRDVFILTVNKVPISRILETADIGAETFYRKLEFIHERCQAFAGQREARLVEGKIELPKLYLSTDRQAYIVNWAHRKDRRTIQMNAIGTADWRSGFVFGMALNFDGSLDPTQVEADATATGDTTLAAPYR